MVRKFDSKLYINLKSTFGRSYGQSAKLVFMCVNFIIVGLC